MYLAVSDHAVSPVLIRQKGGYPETGILFQQNVGGCKDSVFAAGENGTSSSTGACFEETTNYFQAHIVWVLTDYPLQSLSKRLDFTERIPNGEQDWEHLTYGTSREIPLRARCWQTLWLNLLLL